MNEPNFLGALIVLAIAILVSVALFLMFRAFVLWYWKIDEIVNLLRSIDSHLYPGRTRAGPSSGEGHAKSQRSERLEVKKTVKCPKCGAEQEKDEDSLFCDQCAAPLKRVP
jgi:hypothetical protein